MKKPYSTTTNTSPDPTVSPTTAPTRITRPAFGDFSSFCIFIASMKVEQRDKQPQISLIIIDI